MDRSTDLVEVLTGLGVDVHKVQNDEINGRCPVHYLYKGRESSRFSWYINSDSGLWYCFSCGARGNLSMLVSQLTDDPQALWRTHTHLINSGIQRLTDEDREHHEPEVQVDWVKYSKFAQLPDRVLKHRKIEAEVANRYGIRWDSGNRAVVLPIVSPLGELKGWQLKKSGWVRNHPVGVHKGKTLFGIERSRGSTALLLESPLDVARFHSVYEGDKYSAVASFGANVSDEQVRILADKFDGIVVALDNDPAGKAETKRLAKVLPSFRSGIKYWKYDAAHKDLGDMPYGSIIKGLTNVTSIYV